jgi:hypothetical protein
MTSFFRHHWDQTSKKKQEQSLTLAQLTGWAPDLMMQVEGGMHAKKMGPENGSYNNGDTFFASFMNCSRVTDDTP